MPPHWVEGSQIEDCLFFFKEKRVFQLTSYLSLSQDGDGGAADNDDSEKQGGIQLCDGDRIVRKQIAIWRHVEYKKWVFAVYPEPRGCVPEAGLITGGWVGLGVHEGRLRLLCY